MTSEERAEAFKEFLDMRNVHTPCRKCAGLGIRTYSSTATWRSGPAGQMFTADVCDICWGTGDANKSGVDLKKLYAYLRKIENENRQLRKQIPL